MSVLRAFAYARRAGHMLRVGRAFLKLTHRALRLPTTNTGCRLFWSFAGAMSTLKDGDAEPTLDGAVNQSDPKMPVSSPQSMTVIIANIFQGSLFFACTASHSRARLWYPRRTRLCSRTMPHCILDSGLDSTDQFRAATSTTAVLSLPRNF